VGAGTEKRSNFWAKAENKIFGPTNKKIERQGFFPNVFLNLKKCVIQEKTFAKKTFSVFLHFSMSDRWDDGGSKPVRAACFGCGVPEEGCMTTRSMYASGVNAYCADMGDCHCHDPNRYRLSKGTWYLPTKRSLVPPVAPYPLFKKPNLMYTPGPSYLNAVANDPSNPLHYMAKSNGSRFIG
jgi:hypothetical protein